MSMLVAQSCCVLSSCDSSFGSPRVHESILILVGFETRCSGTTFDVIAICCVHGCFLLVLQSSKFVYSTQQECLVDQRNVHAQHASKTCARSSEPVTSTTRRQLLQAYEDHAPGCRLLCLFCRAFCILFGIFEFKERHRVLSGVH